MADAPNAETARKVFIGLLIAITAIGPMSTQMFLPALPVMQADFGATTATAQLALSAAFLTMAFFQIGYGPWSDRLGRKPVLRFALVLFLVGNIVCIFAPNVYVLIIGRVMQAAGGCVGIVLSRAIALDVYGSEKAASVVALTTAAMALAPMLAPAIGGVLTDYFGWRSTFVFMLTCGAALTAVVLARLPETNPDHKVDSDFPTMIRWYARLLKSRIFLAFALNSAFTMGVFFSFVSAAPHVTVNVMDRPATEFGLWFIIVAAGYVAGNLVSAKIANRAGADRMVLTGGVLSLASIGAMGVLLATGGWAPWALFVPGAVTSFAAGLSLPSANVAASAVDPELAGTASGMVGFLNLFLGAIAAQIVGIIQGETPYPMVIAMALMSVLALSALALKRHGSVG